VAGESRENWPVKTPADPIANNNEGN